MSSEKCTPSATPKIRVPVTHECPNCGGDGDLQSYCFDCGEELYRDNLAPADRNFNRDCDDICKDCMENRKEEAAELAERAQKANGT